MSNSKQIIAMGGGGFSMEPDNPLLDQYVLNAAGKPNPRVCFFPHATDDAVRYSLMFFRMFSQLECRPSVLSLFDTPPMADMRGFLLSQDVIYVGGGNTKSMLALWREWGIDAILREAYAQGTVLAGISAGANCWFQAFITDSATPHLSAMHNGLAFLPGSFCPHYDGEAERRPTYQRLIANGEIANGIACDDGAAAHFIDGELLRIVCSRPHARGYTLKRGSNNEAMEMELPAIFQGRAS
jgi:peptidase E